MPAESAIQRISGRALILRGHDIDTDRIIPARFLKAVSFEGLEHHVFADDRVALKARGETHPFDDPARAGAAVLIADANYGCGSSREHAPQALQRWGIRAIIAESFAEIFAGNALAIGLVCVTAAAADLAAIRAEADADARAQVAVDIEAAEVVVGGRRVPIVMPASVRDALVSGQWDATSLLMADYEEVERVEARLPYLRVTSRNA